MNSTRAKIFISVLVGTSAALGISHRYLNFWGLELHREALILFTVASVLSFISYLFLDRVFHLSITKSRWLIFLFPALIVSAVLTWYFFRAPSIWHTLQILPAPNSTGSIELYEIKTGSGRVINLSKINKPKGWRLEDDKLKSVNANPEPLTISFYGAIGAQAELLFLHSPNSRDVLIRMNGSETRVDLRAAETSLRSARVTTTYKMGIPAGLILTLVTAADFLTYFFLILAFWLIQEFTQIRLTEESLSKADSFPPHHIGLIFLLALSVIFHALNFFSVPLITASDSSSYLQGAIHWMQYHNLDGVPAARGPGSTFLFIPAFILFGKNPWGVKIVLHLLAIGVIPMMYALGWNLYKRRAFAFFAGLIAIFIPELYLFSNIVMSDAPNVFFVLAYCVTLLSAFEEITWKRTLLAMLVGSFSVLLRPENILLLAIGAGFLFLKIIWEKQELSSRLKIFIVAVVFSALPLILWSAHNQRVYGFFGLSNYADEVLYDGWVYFGEASNIHITDENSFAVKKIQQAVDAYDKPLGETYIPTGWEIYPALLDYGYTKNEAIQLLGNAARDSIFRDPNLTLQVYLLKFKKAFIPPHSGVMEKTFTPAKPFKTADYFESEQPVFTGFISTQQKIYKSLPLFDRYLYRPLVFFALAAALFGLYQKPFFKWATISVIALSRMFIPITIGIAHWHYMLAGIFILLPFIFLPIQNMRIFLKKP